MARDGGTAKTDAGPARLYATLIGALLVVLGIVGFFYSASFGSPGEVEDALGVFAVNGWANSVYALVGAIGLLVAGFAARRFALWAGIGFLVAGIWGLAIGGDPILGFLPAGTGESLLRLALGLLGLGAYRGTPGPSRA